MVGPPSEELNCFDAMKLWMQSSVAEGTPLQGRLFTRISLIRIRLVGLPSQQSKPCRLHDEQEDRCYTYWL